MMLLALSACADRNDQQTVAEVGLQALVSAGNSDWSMEVIRVEDNMVTTEFRLGEADRFERDYYRGLITVGGTGSGGSFYLDLDKTKLDKLFPLEVGDTVELEGRVILGDTQSIHSVQLRVDVLKDYRFDMNGRYYNTKVVSVERIYRYRDQTRFTQEKVYFSPDLGVVLKTITQSEGQRRIWYAKELKSPNDLTRPQRRSGRVMI